MSVRLKRPTHGSVRFAPAATTAEVRAAVGELLEGYRHLMPAECDARILLKPNLNSNMNALTGNTSDLRLLAALIRWFQERGYRNITIGEGANSGFYREGISVISRLGVDRLGKLFGVRVIDLNRSDPVPVAFSGSVTAQVAREVMEADLLVNVPKLKTHFEVGMSVCMKNLMGCLVGQQSKKKTHQNLAANIVLLNQQVRPQLHVVDAMIAMEGLGPTRGTPVRVGLVLAGDDPVRLDLACARLARFERRSVRTLAQAEQWGLVDTDDVAYVDALPLEPYCRAFARPHGSVFARFIHHPKRQKYFLRIRNTPLFDRLCRTELVGKLLFKLGLRQDVFIAADGDFKALRTRGDLCDQCGKCVGYCPVDNVPWQFFERRQDGCVKCLYCYCVCPQRALQIDGKPGFFAEQLRQYDDVVRQET